MSKNFFFLIIFCIVFSSCSMLGVLVGKIDYYIAKKTSSRLNLYVKQEEKLHTDVEKLLDSIKPEMTVFSSLLKSVPEKNKKIEQQFVNDFMYKIKAPLESFFLKRSQVLSYYLSVLTVKQQKAFSEDLDKKNKKALKRLKKNNYFEKIADRFELLLGDLTPKQNLVLKKFRFTYNRWQEKRLQINAQYHKNLNEAFLIKKESKRKERILKIGQESIEQLMNILQGPLFNEILKSYFLVLKEAKIDQRETLAKKIQFINGLIADFLNINYTS